MHLKCTFLSALLALLASLLSLKRMMKMMKRRQHSAQNNPAPNGPGQRLRKGFGQHFLKIMTACFVAILCAGKLLRA
jgi:hypothetical protein